MLPDTGMTKDKPNRNRDQTSEEEGQGQTGQKRGCDLGEAALLRREEVEERQRGKGCTTGGDDACDLRRMESG